MPSFAAIYLCEMYFFDTVQPRKKWRNNQIMKQSFTLFSFLQISIFTKITSIFIDELMDLIIYKCYKFTYKGNLCHQNIFICFIEYSSIGDLIFK